MSTDPYPDQHRILDQLAPDLPWTLDVFVPGQAVTKGSTKAFAIAAPNTKRGMRAVVTADNGDDQQAWGSMISATVAQAWRADRLAVGAAPAPTMDPVIVWVDAVLPRRRSAPKARTAPHTRKPDGDKLIRLVWDAITHIVLHDDAIVVGWGGSKREAEPDEQPGARIRVCVLDPDGAVPS